MSSPFPDPSILANILGQRAQIFDQERSRMMQERERAAAEAEAARQRFAERARVLLEVDPNADLSQIAYGVPAEDLRYAETLKKAKNKRAKQAETQNIAAAPQEDRSQVINALRALQQAQLAQGATPQQSYQGLDQLNAQRRGAMGQSAISQQEAAAGNAFDLAKTGLSQFVENAAQSVITENVSFDQIEDEAVRQFGQAAPIALSQIRTRIFSGKDARSISKEMEDRYKAVRDDKEAGEDKIRGEATAAGKEAFLVADAFGRIENAATTDMPTGQTDYALIFNWVKLNDRGIVTENDFVTAASGGRLFPQAQQAWTKLSENKILEPKDRREILAAARGSARPTLKRFKDTIQGYRKLAKRKGLDPSMAVPTFFDVNVPTVGDDPDAQAILDSGAP